MKLVLSFIFLVILLSIDTVAQSRLPNDLTILGRKTNIDKVLEFDIGLGAANPKIKGDFGSNSMQVAHDGVTYNTILTSASLIYQHTFDLSGPYAVVIGTSANDQGERFICPFASGCQINEVCMWVKTKGSAGTTTLDLKYSTKAVPNTFATIFSTAPAATTTITNGEYKCTGDSGTGWTIPVMSPSPFLLDQYDNLRLDVTGVMTDSEDVGLVIIYQPQ